MKVLVNGEAQVAEAPLTVLGLLEVLDMGGRPVVVEWNEKALLPREYETTALSEGDRLEIVQITAGG